MGRHARNAEQFRRLFDRHPGEVTQRDKSSFDRVDLLEPTECLVQREQVIGRQARWQVGQFELRPVVGSPPCLVRFLRRADSTTIRRMASAAAAKKWPRESQGWSGADQSQICLVDEGGRLQRLAGWLGGHPGAGEFA